MQAVDKEYRWKTLGPATVLPSFSQAPQPAAGIEEASSAASHAPSEREAGYEAGYAEGEAAGRAAAQAANQHALASLQEAAAELSRVRGEVFERSFADMADVLKTLFQKLFLYELSTSPALLETLCDELQRAMQSAATPELRVSPNDFKQIAPVAEGLAVSIKEDAHLPSGVMRGIVGKTVAELDVNANLDAVFAQASLEMAESGAARDVDAAHPAASTESTDEASTLDQVQTEPVNADAPARDET